MTEQEFAALSSIRISELENSPLLPLDEHIAATVHDLRNLLSAVRYESEQLSAPQPQRQSVFQDKPRPSAVIDGSSGGDVPFRNVTEQPADDLLLDSLVASPAVLHELLDHTAASAHEASLPL